MRYLTLNESHAGLELREVFRNVDIDRDERNFVISKLVEVHRGIARPEDLGVADDVDPEIFIYRSKDGASWRGGIGIWLAFTFDDEGVLVVLAAKDFSGSEVEHGVHLSASKRRLAEGTPSYGEEIEL